MIKHHLELKSTDREYLETLVKTKNLKIRTFQRATRLLELSRGKTLQAVAQTLSVNYNTVAAWRDAYQTQGLKFLIDQPRSGRPVQIDGRQRAQITALACSEAPTGYGRWTLRLLAAKVVELGYCEEISSTQVGKILKKTN